MGRTLLASSACACVLAAPAALAASPASAALKPSEFSVSSLCSAPAPGYAGCLGLRLVARDPLAQPGARALGEAPQSPEEEPPAQSDEAGESLSGAAAPTQNTEFTKPNKKALTPANLLSAYNLNGVTPSSTQTVAIVDAFDSTTIASDLQVFSSQFGLPACSEANGCFRKVNQLGKAAPLPASAGELERGWAQEIATDVETVHGLCPSCHIVLVEAESNSNANLYAAEQTAASLGATEISNSFGGGEPSFDNAAFNHPGVVIVASSGDYGYLNWFSETAPESADYPASSPHVVAVGGTRLNLNATTKAWESETVWNDGGFSGGALRGSGAGGGGCSVPFAAPTWQLGLANWASVGCAGTRAVADVSADADPYTGVAVYDATETEGNKGWATIGGTSVAAPIIASVFALAGGAHGVAYPARTLYENELIAPASLHDVTVGSNGECRKPFEKSTGTSGCTVAEQAQTCSAHAICLAGGGYDGPTGLGTPNGLLAFAPSGTLPNASEGGEAAGGSPPSSTPPPTGTSSPGTAPLVAGAGATAAPVLSRLTLTRSARAALARRHLRLSKLGFAFTLTAPAHVRVMIYRYARVHGRMIWKAVAAPLTIAAGGGAQSRRLGGGATLPAGRYRLTLAPERGAAKSIVFLVR
ncbi:MAG: S53 family peptidase [Solirubrobacteraceae bacterium]